MMTILLPTLSPMPRTVLGTSFNKYLLIEKNMYKKLFPFRCLSWLVRQMVASLVSVVHSEHE